MNRPLQKFLFLFAVLFIAQQARSQFNYGFFPHDTVQSEAYHIIRGDSCFFIESETSTVDDKIIYLKMDLQGNIIQKKVYNDSLIFCWGVYYNTFKLVNNKLIHAGVYRDTTGEHAEFLQLDQNLNVVYQKKYHSAQLIPGAKQTSFWDFQSTPDKGYIFAGEYILINGTNVYYPFLMKTDSLGNVQWKQIYNRTQFALTSFRKMVLTPDLGILLITSKNNGTIIKTNALGVIQWEADMLNDSLLIHSANMVYAGNNEWIVSSVYMHDWNSYFGHEGLYLLKINSLTGNISWHKRYYSYVNVEYYNKTNVFVHPNGNITLSSTVENFLYFPLFGGYKWQYEGSLLHFNSTGDSIGNTRLYVDSMAIYNESRFELDDILLLDNGTWVGVGAYWNPVIRRLMAWVFSTGAITGMSDYGTKTRYPALKIFPNPAAATVHLSGLQNTGSPHYIDIYNSYGKKIKRIIIAPGRKEITMDISSLNPGIYFVQEIGNGRITAQGKLVKVE